MDRSPEFTAIAFHDSLPGGKASGILTIVGNSLQFKSGTTVIKMPLASLEIELGGAANRLLFFSSPLLTEWSLYTSDRSILRVLERTAENRDTRLKIKTLRRHTLIVPLTITVVIVATFLILWGLWQLRTPAISWIAGKMPVAWEQAVGEKLFLAIRADLHLLEDSQASAALTTPAEPLTTRINQQYGFTPKLFIALDPTLNAFAAPGGYIVINSGIINKAQNAEEILGVLAHELSHVSERHVIRGIVSSVGIYFIFSVLIGDGAGVAAILHQAAPYLLSMQYSREQEREADRLGMKLLVATETNPLGMVTMFEKLSAEEQRSAFGDAGAYLSLLGSHPATTERIAEMKSALARVAQSAPPQSDTRWRDTTKQFKVLRDRIGALSSAVK